MKAIIRLGQHRQPVSPASRAELVVRARAREEAALRSIVQANNRRLYRLARRIQRNDSEAEDVVRETYIRGFTHLESFRGDSGVLATALVCGSIAIVGTLALSKKPGP